MKPTEPTFVTRVLKRIDEIDSASWDALQHHGSPFLSYAFLALLERSGCVGPRTSWAPCHIVVESVVESGSPATVVGAMPLYLRSDSSGEYIFDFAWAEAAQRAGVPYYPKLTCAVPFTPATGPRFLLAAHLSESEGKRVRLALLAGARALMAQTDASSLHMLYARDDEATFGVDAHLLRRASVQFHWRNDGYASFDDFLSRFSHEARKQVKRERRRVVESGLAVEVKLAREVPRDHWPTLYRLYASIYQRKWGRPYLNEAFFLQLPDVLPDHALIATASEQPGGVPLAMTLSFERDGNIYGRYWGTDVDVPGLHFELCYHRLIDRAIERKMALVEAGAQGEHKIKRGFLPVLTHSLHEIAHPQLAHAVARACAREEAVVKRELSEFDGPFKEGAAPPWPRTAGVTLGT